MESDSGGAKAKKSRETANDHPFTFKTSITASIVDKGVEDLFDDDQDELMRKYLKDTGAVNCSLKLAAYFQGITDDHLSWTVNSEADMKRFSTSVKNGDVKKRFLEFFKKTDVRASLKLSKGKKIEIQIQIDELKKTLKTAKDHFTKRSSEKAVDRHETEKKESTLTKGPKKRTFEGDTSDSGDDNKGSHIPQGVSPNDQLSTQPDPKKRSVEGDTSDRGDDTIGSHIQRGASPHDPLSTQPDSNKRSVEDVSSLGGDDSKGSQIQPDAASLSGVQISHDTDSNKRSVEDVSSLGGDDSKGSQIQPGAASLSGDQSKHDTESGSSLGHDSSSVDPLDRNGKNVDLQKKRKTRQIVLYVPGKVGKITVEYCSSEEFDAEIRRTEVLTPDPVVKSLWVAKTIDCPWEQTLYFAFDIYSSFLFGWNLRDRDKHLRSSKSNTRVIYAAFPGSDLNSYIKFIEYLLSLNISICDLLHEIDSLSKCHHLSDQDKFALVCRITNGSKSFTSLDSRRKGFTVVSYIFGKYQTKVPIHYTEEKCKFITASPMILENLRSLAVEDITQIRLPDIQYSAETICKLVHPDSFCILLMMKYCSNLFNCQYFANLQRWNHVPFSSKYCDEDIALRKGMFDLLSKKLKDGDQHARYLWEILVPETALEQSLEFRCEEYPSLEQRFCELLSDQVQVTINELRQTRDWEMFGNVCKGVSRHKALREKYSSQLTGIALHFLQSFSETTRKKRVSLPALFNSTCLFAAEHDIRQLLHVLSKSDCLDIHNLYLTMLDEIQLDDPSHVLSTAHAWLQKEIRFLQVSPDYDSPVDMIGGLYTALQKLTTCKKVKTDNLEKPLENKVLERIKDIDVEQVLTKCVKTGFKVPELLLIHLREISTHSKRGEDMLTVIERLLGEEKSHSENRKDTIALGVHLLKNEMQKAEQKDRKHYDEMLIAVKNRKLIVHANSTLHHNDDLKYLHEKNRNFLDCLLDGDVDVLFMRNLDKLIKESGYQQLKFLFTTQRTTRHPISSQSDAVKKVETYIPRLDYVLQEVENTISALEAISRIPITCFATLLKGLIGILRNALRDISTGKWVQIRRVHDRSKFDILASAIPTFHRYGHLWKSHIFVTIFETYCTKIDKTIPDLSTEDLLKAVECSVELYQNYWQEICTNDQMAFSDLILVSTENVDKEVSFLKRLTTIEVSEAVIGALQLAGSHRDYVENVELVKTVCSVLNMDVDKDEEFAHAVSAITDIDTHQDTMTMEGLKSANRCFDGIKKMLETDFIDTLQEFSKSENLLDFIKEIRNEDLRNLIGAVEEFFDDSVQEVTVSSLIDVRRFMEPLMEENPSCVRDLLIRMDSSIRDNELVGVAGKLKECNDHLHSLRSLFHNVANRGEITRDIVKAVIQNEDVVVSVKVNGENNVDVLLSIGERKLTHTELGDYRSRALLLVNSDSCKIDNDSQEGTTDRDMEVFIEYVDNVQSIMNLYEHLLLTGYPLLDSMLSITKHDLSDKANCLEETLDEWITAVREARAHWYWLNHFFAKQITQIKNFLYDGSTDENITSLLKGAGCTKTLEPSDDLFTHFSKEREGDRFQLTAVGATLKERFQGCIAVGPYFPDDESFSSEKVRPLERVQEGEIFVVNLSESATSVIPSLLTLYRNTTGHVPCHHQVLFCSESTSWESLQIFLNKSVGAKKNNLPNQLYCCVNVQDLRNEEQFRLVDTLKEIRNDVHLLAFICKGSANHPLISHFSENVHKVRPMLNNALERCMTTLSPDTLLLTSELPGQGKTERVHSIAFGKKLELVSVHISGSVCESSLISTLKLLMKNDCILHLDIGNICHAESLDIIIFKLCIWNCLSSSDQSLIIPTKYIVLELANSINNTLQKCLPTTRYFHKEHLQWKRFADLRVSREVNSPVQVACHYLKQLSLGALDESDIYFTGEIAEDSLPGNECRDILRQQFSSMGELSYSVVNILLCVLADQLKKMSCSLYLRANSLLSVIGTNTVKSSLVKELLDVSTEFATRSVSACRENQVSTTAEEMKSKMSGHGSTEIATASAMTERLKGMIQWEDSNHLVITFHNYDVQTCSVLYRQLDSVHEHVKSLFKTQMNKDLPDFKSISEAELIERLQDIAQLKPKSEHNETRTNYAMTPDNLLKMILIIMRIRSHIPVIIMGETGCGKTSLLRTLAHVCDVRFEVKNVHAGTDEGDIIECVNKAAAIALANLDEQVWLFFDEINTCDHLGLLNNLVCHHVHNGQYLPANLSMLAACNPYKLRGSRIHTAGLDSKVHQDEQSKLVYRVNPLPERMVDYVWDFGSLSESDETAYIRSMVSQTLVKVNPDLLVKLLVMSQAFAREIEHSPYSVSLRDVNRCRILIPWFREELLPKLDDKTNDEYKDEIESVVMALAHCYHSRLDQIDNRKVYRDKIAKLFQEFDIARSYSCTVDANFVFGIIQKNQKAILERMAIPDGIARNTALQENIFVIFVCLLKHIPVFLVGKPGCSKSLSLQLLKSNMRGKDSTDDFFKGLPQLYYLSFQGSESSTSAGIVKVFEKAEKYRKHNKEKDVLPVVILDEVGLAEVSPYNPLKVLHNLLEPHTTEFPDIAVVGISNWALDAAKMNRAIHLSRPDMDVRELHDTAVAIAEASTMTPTHSREEHERITSRHMEGLMKALATAYFEYVQKQKINNFHGLRDFYSLVKFYSKSSSCTSNRKTDEMIVMEGLFRNFGGLESEINYILNTFQVHLQKELNLSSPEIHQPRLQELINANVNDRSARHLMLLTRGDSSLSFVETLLRDNNTPYMTILGSSFEEDQSDHYNYRILSRIILCMEQGITLILKDLDTIYGSLYDMLNQNYTVVGRKRNCRIALGAYSNPLCQVHDDFRCIVLVEIDKVDYSDPPFLNRFEKQKLVLSDVIDPENKEVVVKLESVLEDMAIVTGYESISPKELIPMYDHDLIPSLVQSNHDALKIVSNEVDSDDLQQTCLAKLIPLLAPEGVIRAKRSSLMAKNEEVVRHLQREYFSQPLHYGLENYLESFEKSRNEDIAAMIFTHSSVYVDIRNVLDNIQDISQFEKLGSFRSEKQLSNSVKSFFSDNKNRWMFIQVTSADKKHFHLMKSILEQERNRYKATEVEHDLGTKNIVVILHLDRNSPDQTAPVNFLSVWHMAMIDSLERSSFPMDLMLKSSMVQLTTRFLTEIGITQQDLFWAFSCISYSSKQRSISNIMDVIKVINDSKPIKAILGEVVQREVKHSERKDDWQLEIACQTSKLQNNLTFHGALFEEMRSRVRHPLAAVMYIVESMNGWDFLNNFETYLQKLPLWRDVTLTCMEISNIPAPKGSECYPCKLSTFNTRFHYSRYFIDKIENLERLFMDMMRGHRVNSRNEYDETAVDLSLLKSFRRSIGNVARKMFDYSCYGNEQFQDYFHDFSQWSTADMSLTIPEASRIQAFQHAIRSRISLCEEEGFDTCVTKLHMSRWKFKYQLDAELILVDTCISELSVSIDEILDMTYASGQKQKDSDAKTKGAQSETRSICSQETSEEEEEEKEQPQEEEDDDDDDDYEEEDDKEDPEELKHEVSDDKTVDARSETQPIQSTSNEENDDAEEWKHKDSETTTVGSKSETRSVHSKETNEIEETDEGEGTGNTNKEGEEDFKDDIEARSAEDVDSTGDDDRRLNEDHFEDDGLSREEFITKDDNSLSDELKGKHDVNEQLSARADSTDDSDGLSEEDGDGGNNDGDAVSNEDMESKSDKGSTSSGEDLTEESDDEDTVASNLVDKICLHILPSTHMKDILHWQKTVNLILSLTLDVSVFPISLSKLRVCYDIASLIILPYDIDPELFWQICKTISSKELDESCTVSLIRNLSFSSSMQAMLIKREDSIPSPTMLVSASWPMSTQT